jgi:hypothetical protein
LPSLALQPATNAAAAKTATILAFVLMTNMPSRTQMTVDKSSRTRAISHAAAMLSTEEPATNGMLRHFANGAGRAPVAPDPEMIGHAARAPYSAARERQGQNAAIESQDAFS